MLDVADGPTSFFIPHHTGSRAAAEARYQELRSLAERDSVSGALSRRICSINCRLEGRDATVCVGDTERFPGETVSAIFQLGRTGYTLLVDSPDSPGEPRIVLLSRSVVYDAVDFDR